MTDVLTKEGAQVEGVTSGLAAIQRVSATQPPLDAVLMDVQMPGMGGIAATQIIRADPASARLPIIAMTAHVLPADVQKCRIAGMNAHLGKPVAIDQLVELLLGLCRAEDFTVVQGRHPALKIAAQGGLPQVPGFDLNDTLQRLGSNRTLYASAGRRFRKAYADLPTHLLFQYQTEGPEAAAKSLHTLKGTAATLGARDLAVYASAMRMEVLRSAEGLDDARILGLAQRLESAFNVLEAAADILETTEQ